MVAKTQRRVKHNLQCSVCGKTGFSAQGLNGHMRFAHNAPSVLSEKSKRRPVLVKPPLRTPELELSLAKFADANSPSPCCQATLRNAKRVFGLFTDSALDECYVCAQCGEWYKPKLKRWKKGVFSEPRGAVKVWHDLPNAPEWEMGLYYIRAPSEQVTV